MARRRGSGRALGGPFITRPAKLRFGAATVPFAGGRRYNMPLDATRQRESSDAAPRSA